MNQTKVIATAPIIGEPGATAHAHVIVNTGRLQDASAEARRSLEILLLAAIRRRGGDPTAVTYTTEPIGPQIRLATVNGKVL